jgi:hypothetical protein
MKKFRLPVIVILVLAVLILAAAPVLAGPPPLPGTPPPTPNVNGVELFPGIDFGGINWGATFTAQAVVPFSNGLHNGVYNCILTASVNYTPDAPSASGNQIVGGSFSLIAMQNGRNIGAIKGKIPGGSILWSGGSSGTDYGLVSIPTLTISSTSYPFVGAKGGSFIGYDDHVDGPKLFGITVPTVMGYLEIHP